MSRTRRNVGLAIWIWLRSDGVSDADAAGVGDDDGGRSRISRSRAAACTLAGARLRFLAIMTGVVVRGLVGVVSSMSRRGKLSPTGRELRGEWDGTGDVAAFLLLFSAFGEGDRWLIRAVKSASGVVMLGDGGFDVVNGMLVDSRPNVFFIACEEKKKKIPLARLSTFTCR